MLLQVLKVQSMIRAMIARRRMARKQAQRMVGKGPQPLVGKLRLRLEGGQGHNQPSQRTPFWHN